MSYLHQLLYECMNLDEAQAGRVVEVLLRVEVVTPEALERFERNARVYHLRGTGLRTCDLVLRFGLSRAGVCEIVRRHGKRRREALKFAS